MAAARAGGGGDGASDNDYDSDDYYDHMGDNGDDETFFGPTDAGISADVLHAAGLGRAITRKYDDRDTGALRWIHLSNGNISTWSHRHGASRAGLYEGGDPVTTTRIVRGEGEKLPSATADSDDDLPELEPAAADSDDDLPELEPAAADSDDALPELETDEEDGDMHKYFIIAHDPCSDGKAAAAAAIALKMHELGFLDAGDEAFRRSVIHVGHIFRNLKADVQKSLDDADVRIDGFKVHVVMVDLCIAPSVLREAFPGCQSLVVEEVYDHHCGNLAAILAVKEEFPDCRIVVDKTVEIPAEDRTDNVHVVDRVVSAAELVYADLERVERDLVPDWTKKLLIHIVSDADTWTFGTLSAEDYAAVAHMDLDSNVHAPKAIASPHFINTFLFKSMDRWKLAQALFNDAPLFTRKEYEAAAREAEVVYKQDLKNGKFVLKFGRNFKWIGKDEEYTVRVIHSTPKDVQSVSRAVDADPTLVDDDVTILAFTWFSEDGSTYKYSLRTTPHARCSLDLTKVIGDLKAAGHPSVDGGGHAAAAGFTAAETPEQFAFSPVRVVKSSIGGCTLHISDGHCLLPMRGGSVGFAGRYINTCAAERRWWRADPKATLSAIMDALAAT